MKPENLKRLGNFLSQIPESTVISLITALEIDRLKNAGKGLPHNDLLALLRPRLAHTSQQVARIPSPQRLFCDPFEDLIYTGRNPQKLPGRIVRKSLTPIWDWLGEDLIPAKRTELEKRISQGILAGDDEQMYRSAAELHQVAGDVLQEMIRSIDLNDKSYKEVSHRLGTERTLADVRDVAVALRAAPHLEEIRRHFPIPIVKLDEDDVFETERQYRALKRHAPEATGLLFSLLMSRMQEPWKVISLARELGLSSGTSDDQTTEMQEIVDTLLSDASELSHHVKSYDIQRSDLHQFVDGITEFQRLSSGLSESVADVEVASWDRSLRVQQNQVAGVMESLLERSPEKIMEAIPIRKIGGFAGRGTARPDLSQWPQENAVKRAVDHAVFLDGLRYVATKAAFGDVYRDVVDTMENTIVRYSENIVNEIRATDGEEREKAEAYLDVAVQLTRHILGETEANLLKRRAQAALV